MIQYHTLESRVSSDIQTPRSWLKNSAIALFSAWFWISDEKLLVYDILLLGLIQIVLNLNTIFRC